MKLDLTSVKLPENATANFPHTSAELAYRVLALDDATLEEIRDVVGDGELTLDDIAAEVSYLFTREANTTIVQGGILVGTPDDAAIGIAALRVMNASNNPITGVPLSGLTY